MRLTAVMMTMVAAMLAVTGWADVMSAGVMHPGGFPTPVGEVAEQITWLYNAIYLIVAVVSVVVVVPIAYILWKFRRDKVAKPATFSHSLVLELTWTIIPALICLFIAVASYKSMIFIRTIPEDAMNVEVVGYQFGWDFYYPDYSEKGVHVAAAEPTSDDPEVSLPGAPRQTKELIVPVGVPVALHVTGADVIHSMYVPHLAVKIDAVPGRINYAWFKADKAGNWLGQCTELCGQAHGEMFFRVKAVPQAEFDTYIQARRVAAGLTPVHVDAPSVTEVVSGTVVSGTEVSGTAVSATVEVSAVVPVVASATGVVSASQ